ncbi:unnamed protein product [Dibothriocephalus latus]|uniref:BACK domain-containing protein n=1 Tax=Dibothriocephalus latus TaxID=60516 RepID=A0A3P7P0Q2_DIBLA|nr:unnamed protein product [Dibothriocephalus latus]
MIKVPRLLEQVDWLVRISEVRLSASTLIDYLYTGRIEITFTNAMNMILLAKQLSLPCVENWGVTFLSARLQNDNLSECWEFAAAANCTGLQEACVQHMNTFFEATVANDLFLELPADVVLAMLRNDDLQVDSEEKVFEAVKRWVCPTGILDEGRIIHAPEMLKEVRWNQTEHSFRRRLLESDDLIGSSVDCIKCIGLADHWIGYSSLRNQEECPFNASRRLARLATCVLVFGKSAVNDLPAVYQYDLKTKTCDQLSTVDGLQDARFLAHGGGADGPMNTIEKFIPSDPPTADLSSWSWAALDSLNDLTIIHGAVAIQQF